MRGESFMAVSLGGALRSVLAVVVLTLVSSSWASAQAEDQKDRVAPQDKPGASGEKAPKGKEADALSPQDDGERLLRRREKERRRLLEERRVIPGPWAWSPWYPWYPWYPLPQTYPRGAARLDLLDLGRDDSDVVVRFHDRKAHPPSVTHTPQLGLQHIYPGGYQMGFRIPDDSDELALAPNVSPFYGVVGLAKAEALRGVQPAGGDEAIHLMKEKKYKEAGRLLADLYRDSDDPRYPLLLAEVFLALGKPAHADVLLRKALESPDVEEAFPPNISSHFSSPEEFESKLQDLGASENKLLAAYMLVHSKNPDQGLDLLQKLSREEASARLASLLYRHYLGKVFKEDAKK